MNPAAKAETVKRFREATGMGWMAAKLFFAGRSAELCERILRAHQELQGERMSQRNSKLPGFIANQQITAA